MKRIIVRTIVAAGLLVAFAAPAFAFGWNSINPVNWIKAGLEAGGWQALAWILTVILGLAAFSTVAAVKIIKTLTEAGEFLVALSDAMNDRKITPDEIKTIIADARDVFNVWRETPEAYKTE